MGSFQPKQPEKWNGMTHGQVVLLQKILEVILRMNGGEIRFSTAMMEGYKGEFVVETDPNLTRMVIKQKAEGEWNPAENPLDFVTLADIQKFAGQLANHKPPIDGRDAIEARGTLIQMMYDEVQRQLEQAPKEQAKAQANAKQRVRRGKSRLRQVLEEQEREEQNASTQEG